MDIVEIARSWLGTPVKHQGRVKHHGVDCAGLVIMVGIEARVLTLTDDQIKRLCRYRKVGRATKITDALTFHATKVDDPRPGDIAHMTWGSASAYHLGIISEYAGAATVVHANRMYGSVVEERVPMRNRIEIVGTYRYRGVN
jgi:cell wall-associated NlpC family hydrolase